MKPTILTPLFFILSFCFTPALFPQGEWITLESPTKVELSKVHFIDGNTGWAAGDSGVIIHTIDGGENWIFLNARTSDDFVDLFFLDENFGWALTWEYQGELFGTRIFRTINGGEEWTNEFYQEENFFMKSIFFLDPLTGWMAGSPHALVHTRDGGQLWRQAEIDSGLLSHFPVEHVGFYNSQFGFASGGRIDLAGVIWRTTNAGQSWAATPIGPEPITGIVVLDTNNVVGVGGDFKLGAGGARSTNGGKSWDYQTLSIFGVPKGLAFRTAQEGWAVMGTARQFLFTADAGFTWTNIRAPNDALLFDIAFPDSLTGFAVGDDGVILKYVPSLVSITDRQPPVIPEAITLFQNYPNPFNPATNIGFRISDFGFVELKIFDLSGKIVNTLVAGTKKAGFHEIIWDSTNEIGQPVASGMYLYRLTITSPGQTGNAGVSHQLVRKMVLIK